MKKLNLPDGWYEVPGDEAGDGKRRSKFGNSHRFFYYCLVKDGLIKAVVGHEDGEAKSVERLLVATATETKLNLGYGKTHQAMCEEIWKCKLPDLLAVHIKQSAPSIKHIGAALALVGLGSIVARKSKISKTSKEIAKEHAAVQK